MSGGQLHVESSELTAASQLADHIADQLVGRYSDAAKVVAALLDGAWTGDAADACSDAWQEWSDGFRRVILGLRDEATALQTAAGQYASTDGASASRLNGR